MIFQNQLCAGCLRYRELMSETLAAPPCLTVIHLGPTAMHLPFLQRRAKMVFSGEMVGS